MIKLSKVDVTQDFKGSFIPGDQDEDFEFMRNVLKAEINFMFSDDTTNFLS